MAEYWDQPLGEIGSPTKTKIYFNPDKEPYAIGGKSLLKDWYTLKPRYDEMAQWVQSVEAEYPTLYSAVQTKSINSIAGGNLQMARAMMGSSLRQTLGNINKTKRKLYNKEFLMKLHPIQQNLYDGRAKPSGVDWSDDFYKSLAKDYVEDYEDSKFWEDLLLDSLAAAAFVFASFASFGLGTILLAAGVGITGYQAGKMVGQLELAGDVENAEGAEVNSELTLATEGTGSAMRVGAIVGLALNALDIFGAGKGIATALKPGLSAKFWAKGAPKAYGREKSRYRNLWRVYHTNACQEPS